MDAQQRTAERDLPNEWLAVRSVIHPRFGRKQSVIEATGRLQIAHRNRDMVDPYDAIHALSYIVVKRSLPSNTPEYSQTSADIKALTFTRHVPPQRGAKPGLTCSTSGNKVYSVIRYNEKRSSVLKDA
jgi:hypothetical protein